MTKNSNHWPKISVVMFIYNDPLGVKNALKSVEKQRYPKDRLEIIVVDNNSKDNSATVARKYSPNVFINKTRDGAAMRADGMRKATGDFVYMVMEQDMELKSANFFQYMIKPLIEHVSIVASFTREYPNKKMSWISRFISYHPFQCDPLFEFLSPNIKDSITEKRNGYDMCIFNKNNLPPVTHMLFRREFLIKSGVWRQKRDFDHDTVLKLIDAGYDRFAYVENAGDYHYHANTLKQLIDKRIRNLESHFFKRNDSLKYTWVDVNSKCQILRLFAWVIYANLIIPATIRGIIRSVMNKDIVLLAEPLVTIYTTDAILIKFISDAGGRRVVKKYLRALF